MTLIYLVILCLFFKARSCQLQCVKEMLNDSEFLINVTAHIKEESDNCIWIPYEFTFPTNKVTVPYRKIWFKGDPNNTVTIEVVNNVESGTQDSFLIDGLPQGEYEYGFKLEWECNQTYIFPKRVRISVSAFTKRPDVWVSPMMEGQSAILMCDAESLCSQSPLVHWEWTKADGQSMVLHDIYRNRGDVRWHYLNRLYLTPTADHHNTNITCVANYRYSVVKETVTLTVKFPPKIINGSQCMVEGKLLVCVCISRGNPLPPITWPLASLTDFSVTSSSSIQTVNSTITTPAADYYNSSVKCISSNELGRAEIEIPLQNSTENLKLTSVHDWSSGRQKFDAPLPWITAVSFSLNLVLLTGLIICTYKWRKSTREKLCEEMKTYASLNKADVEQEYSVISPQPR